MVLFRTESAGTISVPELPFLVVSVRVGEPALSSCTRGGRSHYGTSVHGDINIVPPGTPSRWEIIQGTDRALIIVVPQAALDTAAQENDVDPHRVDIRNMFCLRDPQIENIGWALKAELECGSISGRLYTDSLVTAITARVLSRYSSIAGPENGSNRGLSGFELRRLLAHIEDHLTLNLSLTDLALFAGYSTSHLNAAFRRSVGMPIHEYMVRRRLDRARNLLTTSSQSITQIALECGFAHQSHMARHMRRVLGVSPREFRRDAKTQGLRRE